MRIQKRDSVGIVFFQVYIVLLLFSCLYFFPNKNKGKLEADFLKNEISKESVSLPDTLHLHK